MGHLILYILATIGFALFFAYVSLNALRTGVIKGGWGKPVRREKQPKLFAFILAATRVYCILAIIAAAAGVYAAFAD